MKVGETYIAEEKFTAHNTIDGFKVPSTCEFGPRHRLKVYEITEEGVLFGLDPVWYGDTKKQEAGKRERFLMSEENFKKVMITMRDFNLRWLRSICGDAS